MGFQIDLTGQRFGRWTVIEFDTNKSGQTYWKCKCDCGNEKSVSSGRLRSGESQSCGCLSREKTAARFRKDISNQKFGRLTVLYCTNKKNKSGKYLWHCKCDCGNECDVAIDQLTGGNKKSCGCLSKEKASERFGIDETGKIYGKLTVVGRDNSQKYKRIHWLCKCSCGNPNLESIDGYYLRSGERTSCSRCTPRSKGEEEIKEILIKNNIPFTQEQTFKDCVFLDTNRLARFDFYVNNQYIIEFDGKQHTQETSGKCSNWQSLSYVQEHDKIKNNYCFNNNIPLIRIPYEKVNKINLEDLLLETSKYKVNS